MTVLKTKIHSVRLNKTDSNNIAYFLQEKIHMWSIISASAFLFQLLPSCEFQICEDFFENTYINIAFWK